jgi:hypothetical protein
MKKLGIFLLVVSLAADISAQDKNILNHMDVGVNAGTVGIGIDVAVPVGNYVRIRAGYNYMPRFKFHSDFPIETSSGGSIQRFFDKKDKVSDAVSAYDLDQPEFAMYKDAFNKFLALEQKDFKDYVSMGLQPNLHQFKFLVDVMPFKNNKHWSFTTGFFVGPSNIGSAYNLEGETRLLEAVNAYNTIYVEYLGNFCNLPGGHGEVEMLTSFFKANGVAGFPIGYFDEGSRYKAMMVPGEDGTVRAEMEISKIRPYLGLGYNTHLSRNRKWNLNVDAGVLFLCGKPNVYVDNVYSIDVEREKVLYDEYDSPWDNYDIVHPNVNYDYDIPDDPENPQPYFFFDKDDPTKFRQHVDLVHDLYNMPNGKVRDMVNTISKFKVYPNLSVTFSYRLY